MKKRSKMVLALALLTALPVFSALYADSAGKTLDMTFSVRNGTGDEPMIVVWLENDTGDFVQTLHIFSKKKEYYKDMLGWLFKSKTKEKPADVDAVSGATIRWNKTGTFSVPAQIGSHDLLSGAYVLRIESRKDKGSHYRNFKIPLPAGYTGGVHEDEGYVKSVEIKVK
ncbi:MAG: DUF2271 domain-containing protein [Kiritimatiellaceae bacterium]|nr:DUF2271 domain-containing protein [Kiritimatiellaceae bacterium]